PCPPCPDRVSVSWRHNRLGDNSGRPYALRTVSTPSGFVSGCRVSDSTLRALPGNVAPRRVTSRRSVISPLPHPHPGGDGLDRHGVTPPPYIRSPSTVSTLRATLFAVLDGACTRHVPGSRPAGNTVWGGRPDQAQRLGTPRHTHTRPNATHSRPLGETPE